MRGFHHATQRSRWWPRFAAIFGRQFHQLSRDPALLSLMFIAPIILMGLLGKTLGSAYASASGSDQHRHVYAFSVSGFSIMFAFYGAGFLGLAFHHEAAWGTLARCAASRTTRTEIVAGKVAVIGGFVAAQVLLLQIVGSWLLGISIVNWTYIVAAAALTAAWVSVLGMFVVRLAKIDSHVPQIANLVVLLGGVVGGGVAPVTLLPGWIQPAARLVPQRWLLGLSRAGMGLRDGSNAHPRGVILWLAVAAVIAFATAVWLVPWPRLFGVEASLKGTRRARGRDGGENLGGEHTRIEAQGTLES